jgi:hypothetical protein
MLPAYYHHFLTPLHWTRGAYTLGVYVACGLCVSQHHSSHLEDAPRQHSRQQSSHPLPVVTVQVLISVTRRYTHPWSIVHVDRIEQITPLVLCDSALDIDLGNTTWTFGT